MTTLSRSDDTETDLSDAPRFTLREFAGGLGDLGTFLPLSLAVCITCGLDFGIVLIGAGLMNVLSGWWFRQPIPVQPMKALAAVAIAQTLSPGTIYAAGVLIGLIMLVIGGLGLAERMARWMPRAVVYGIQVGIGIKLIWRGATWLAELPPWGFDSLVVAAVAMIALCVWGLRYTWILPVIFVAGFVVLGFTHGAVVNDVSPAWPKFAMTWPATEDWSRGFLHGVLPQLPLTLLNSVLAVCALSASYYPGRGIGANAMASSVGLMNLICVPLGALPMCHGSGGLAAQHHFGARTGGSVIMLGILKIAAGLLLGATLLNVLVAYPKSILAVTLILAGVALARLPFSKKQEMAMMVPIVVTAAGAMAYNTLIGALMGVGVVLLHWVWRRLRPNRKVSD